MFFSEHTSRITKAFLVIFLCSEMQSSFTQNIDFANRVLQHPLTTNSTEASLENARHHASIRLRENDQHFGDGHICSGVVIGHSAVLTTAQCVYNHNEGIPYHPSELKVVLASTNRYLRQQQTLIFSVTHSYQPETFNIHSPKDNVAILMLDSDIPQLNEYVKPIKWYGKVKSRDEYQLTTWLQTNEGLTVNHLMLINATLVSNESCMRYYGNTTFTNGMLCIDSNESLNKDFGAPLLIGNKVVGLRSYSAKHRSPAIYTDISYHAKWIRSVIGDGSNQNSSIWGTLGFLLLTLAAFKRTNFVKHW